MNLHGGVKDLKSKAERLRHEHETAFEVLFFFVGVSFDMLTVDRIDHWFGLTQQGLYLAVLGVLLGTDFAFRNGALTPPTRPWLARVWEYRQFIAHFLFGTLLSTYTIFYFKSSSLFTSFVFLVLLIGLLVINELRAFRRLGPVVKYVLFSLCVASYLAYFVPVMVGTIGPVTFAFSMALTVGILTAQLRPLLARNIPKWLVYRDVLAPALGVVAVFSGLYLIRMIPPVPLSIQHIGIYHGVEKEGGGYVLVHERPMWKFWETGDQYFLARPGDKLFCFARIFSPSRFKDQVMMHWLRLDARGRWETWDRIPLQIVGGREHGFRGYTIKGNFEPGQWRVQVETTDGREIGRIYLRVEPDPRPEERVFTREQV